MKKQYLFAAMLFLAAALTACTNNKTVTDRKTGTYQKNGQTIYVQDQAELYNHGGSNDRFGYVRQVKSPVYQDDMNEGKKFPKINREQIANTISNIHVTLPNVNDSAVLVTDKEVLVAYQTDKLDEASRFETADQVKKSVLSVIPRWYHVYVTDDPHLRREVENISRMDPMGNDVDGTVRYTIGLMLERSPQGRKINAGENENGETINPADDYIYRNDYQKQKKNQHR